MEFQILYPISEFEAIGAITYICQGDENIYSDWDMDDLYYNIAPLIELGQYKIWLESDYYTPIAFVTWACFNEKNEQLYCQDDAFLDDIEIFRSGNRLWLLDFVSPFNNPSKFVKDLCKNDFIHFPYGKVIRRSNNGDIKRFGRFKNPYCKKL